MSSAEITLSSGGLANVAAAPIDRGITVHVGTRRYLCHRELMRFISPKLSMMLSADPMIDEFVLAAEGGEDHFSVLQDLMAGRPATVSEANADFLLAAGEALGNVELVDLVMKFLSRPITKENVLERIERKRRLKCDMSEEITYTASRLFKFDTDTLKSLDLEVLQMILENEKLQLRNESWLFRFICSLISEKGEEYRQLLSCVSFEYLTDLEMTTFLSMVSLEDLTGKMWASLSARLRLNVSSDMTKSVRTQKAFSVLNAREEDFQYSGDGFDGIFANLMKRCGNLFDHGIISVSSSGNISMPPNQLVDNTFNGYWYSTNIPNSWVMIDFGRFRLKPSAYTLRTGHFDPSSVEHLKSWVLEGSYDAQNWSELDRQKNSQDLNGDFKSKTWPCKEYVAFRYIRLRQISKNHHNSNFLFLNNIELFGTLSQGDETAASCVKQNKH